MLGILLKKQFLQMNAFYFLDKKTGKKRSPWGTIGMIALFAFVFFSLGVSIFAVGEMLLKTIHSNSGMDWLYFAMMGVLAVLAGIIGGVFTAYPSLYNAKDNDLLLSLPISPGSIVLSRMFGVYLMCLLYEAIVWIPTMIAYWYYVGATGTSALFSILLIFVITFIVLAISCLVGWVVAIIASHIKNKAIVSVLTALIFIALYYVIYFRINLYLQLLVLYLNNIATFFENYLNIFVMLGRASLGDGLNFLYFIGVSLLIFFVVWYFLQQNFVRVTTRSGKFKKAVFSNKKIRSGSLSSALYHKELRRFWGCPAYILNSGLGLVMEIGLGVFFLLKAGWIRDNLYYLENSETIPQLSQFLTAAIAIIIGFITTMNPISAPSISLEGKYIWVLQSLPIKPWDVLVAKQKLHISLNAFPALFCILSCAVALRLSILETAFISLFVGSFICLFCAIGLSANLKHANLNWTNETIPIKQGISVLIALFGGVATIIATAVIYMALADSVPGIVYLPIVSAVFIFFTVLVNKWLKKKGVKLFEQL